jgi:hypothetical protein
MYFIARARVAETKERARRNIKIKWFEPMSETQLDTCDFYKKNRKMVDKLP